MKSIRVTDITHKKIKSMADSRGMKILSVIEVFAVNGEKILPKPLHVCTVEPHVKGDK